MSTVREAMDAGLRHQKAGRLSEAEQVYRQVLQVEPRHADALHLLGLLADQVGRGDEAIRLVREAIAASPTEPLYHCSLANIQAALGQFDAGMASCHEALRLQPDFAKAHSSLGNLLRLRGRMHEAEAAFREVVRLRPDDVVGRNNLGNVLRSRRKFAQAEACYRDALRLRPAHPVALANLGSVLVELGRLDEAHDCLRPALQLQPRLAEAHAWLGRLLLLRDRLADAETSCRTAIQLAPSLAEAHKNLGMVLYRRKLLNEAEACFREALRLQPDNAEAQLGLGDLFRDRDNIPAARAAFAEAVRLRPDAAEPRNNLAACLIEEGDVAEAIRHLQEVLRLRPRFVPALGNLGTLARDGLYQFRDEDAQEVRTLLDDATLTPAQRSTLGFTLAHVLDKQKRHDEAFFYYRQANDARAQVFREQGMAFDRDQHLRFIEQTRAVATEEFFRKIQEVWGQGVNVPGPRQAENLPQQAVPVFIVGMPRSGTTLVEQILASHPQVHGAGELPSIPQIGAWLEKTVPDPQGYPACLASADAATVRSAAAAHRQQLARLGGGKNRVTDKLPANIFHLPLIHLLFPDAAIIHCLRDPLDVCLSCFVQDFHTLSFATRLEDIGFYYRTYERLADHWRTTFPAPILEVRYEELVDDLEAASRRMVRFCGLDWDDRCLRFHENRRVIRTSSVAQVRQPIYRAAIGRWQRYREHLGPLFAELHGANPPDRQR